MDGKKLIDRKRDSGGSSNIGTLEDGAIEEMITIEGRLIIIKERSIYESIRADDIDPQRTNIGLPNNIHRLLVNQGTESELVGRTFLTAKTLFIPACYDVQIKTERALSLTLHLLEELIVLQEEINNYLNEEKRVCGEYEKRRTLPVSYAIPTIVNLETLCKTIFQKADHVEQILIEIVTIFYPNSELTKQSHFPKFHSILVNKYGEQDPFSEFLSRTLPFMKIIRLLRNGLDHRAAGTVKVRNFELQADSSIISPTIELDHKEGKLERISLFDFLPIVLNNILVIIEDLLAHLASKNGTVFGIYEVRHIPENERRYKFVRYSFWAPFGDTGFYRQ